MKTILLFLLLASFCSAGEMIKIWYNDRVETFYIVEIADDGSYHLFCAENNWSGWLSKDFIFKHQIKK